MAENDDGMRALMVRTLEHTGFRAEAVGSGAALVARLISIQGSDDFPIVIASDRVGPKTSGLDALSLLRPIWPHLPIILLAAFGARRSRERARELGATAILDKPFDVCRLVALVSELATDEPPSNCRSPIPPVPSPQ